MDFYNISVFILRICKFFGFISDFAVEEYFDLPVKLDWYIDNNEWHIEWGYTIVIITPKNWSKPHVNQHSPLSTPTQEDDGNTTGIFKS